MKHMERIKGRASYELNKLHLQMCPNPIWQRHWFDHVVRNFSSLQKIRRYIADHSVPHPEAKFAADWVQEEG